MRNKQKMSEKTPADNERFRASGGQRVRTRQRQKNKIESEVQFDRITKNNIKKFIFAV